jgi:hypothetical protein
MDFFSIPDDLSIPAFLKVENHHLHRTEATVLIVIPQPRRQCTKRRRLHWHDGYPLPYSIEAAGIALFHDLEKQHRERQKQKFAALRERARR